jgi:deoxyribonuclease-4
LKPRIGIHTSISGALENAALHAAAIGADAFQIFTASPRMWRATPIDPAQAEKFKAARDRLGLAPLAVHASYLVNLASSSGELRARSVAAFRAEIERAAAVGADYLIVHPGNYKGGTLEEGIARAAESLFEAARCSVTGNVINRVLVLLENTAGGTNQLGGRLSDLAAIRASAQPKMPLKLGFCIDTCHALAAGYDVSTAAGLRKTIAGIDRVLGLDNVPVFHANDSLGALGSHLDRHANIGEGAIGEEGFRRILRHPRLRGKTFLLETPVDNEGDDRRNVETLRRLAGV